MNPVDQLVERLKLLVFFHLGDDALLEVNFPANGLRASIEHPRVHPFLLEIGSYDLERMVTDTDALEDCFLEQLVAHRRG